MYTNNLNAISYSKNITNVFAHIEHCCHIHGCRFNNKLCPVIQQLVIQKHKCGTASICNEYKGKSLPHN